MHAHAHARPPQLTRFCLIAIAVLLSLPSAQAQVTIAKWNWNTMVRNPPAIGSGMASYIGGTNAPSGEFPSGTGSSDGGFAWSSTAYPSLMSGSGTAGVQFEVSTAGYENIRVRYDAMASSTASRWLLIKYTTDGTAYAEDPTGPKSFSPSAWANNRTLDLTGVAAANDNAAFKFRIVSVFSPNGFTANSVAYLPNSAYQPVGTAATSAYNGGTGTIRFDAVTVLGDPISDTPPSVSVASATPPAACPGGETRLTATIVPGANPPSAIPLTVTVDLTSIGGGNAVALLDDGNPPDATGFDFIYTANASVDFGTTPGLKSLPITVTDHLNRTGSGSISLNVANCDANANSSVVINRVYGAGGNAGALYNADFVELFNRGASGVNITGWSLQYAAATVAGGFATANGVVSLAGVIPPGGYYLVQMSEPGDNGVALPAPDAVAVMTFQGMAANAGRVALVEAITTPIGNDLSAVRDLIGYGATAITFEGAGPAPDLSAALQALRKANGCQDSDQSFNDFETAAPNQPVAPRNSSSPVAPCTPVGCACRADLTGDSIVNGGDIRGFAACATAGGPGCGCGDLTNDAVVNAADIGPFVAALLAGTCAP